MATNNLILYQASTCFMCLQSFDQLTMVTLSGMSGELLCVLCLDFLLRENEKTGEHLSVSSSAESFLFLENTCSSSDLCGFAYDCCCDICRMCVHQVNKTYLCEECHKLFAELSAMNSHKNSAHSTKRSWECTYCTRVYSTIKGLCEHKRLIHLRDVRHRCNDCHKIFYSNELLQSHIDRVHDKSEKSNRYRCGECLQGFRFMREVQLHMRNVHGQPTLKRCSKYHNKINYIWDFVCKHMFHSRCISLYRSKHHS